MLVRFMVSALLGHVFRHYQLGFFSLVKGKAINSIQGNKLVKQNTLGANAFVCLGK